MSKHNSKGDGKHQTTFERDSGLVYTSVLHMRLPAPLATFHPPQIFTIPNSNEITVMKEQQTCYGWGHHSMRTA